LGAEARTAGFYGWKLLAVLWVAMAINMSLPMYGLSILNVHMGDQFGLSRAALGSTYSAYMLMTGLPGPLVARMIHRYGIRSTLIFGNVMLLAATAALATVVDSAWSLLAIGGLLLGTSNAFAGPITIQASVTRWFVRRRALAMGLVMTGGSLVGSVFAPMLETVTRISGSWRYGWWAITGATALVVLACAIFIRENPHDLGQYADGRAPDPAEEGEMAVTPMTASMRMRFWSVHRTPHDWSPRDVLRSTAFWLLLVCSAGVSAVFTIFLAQAVLQMRDLGYSTGTAAWMLSFSVGVGFVAHMVVSFIADRIDPRLLWALGVLFYGLGIILFAQAYEPWELYAAVLLLGIGGSVSLMCIVMVFSNWFGAKASPFVFGYGSAVAAACGALGPIASGYCYDRIGSFAPVYYVVGAMCIASAILLIAMRPPVPSWARQT